MKRIKLGGHRKNSPIKGYATVDDADFEKLNKYNWSYLSSGYAFRYLPKDGKPKCILMHRQIMNPVKGLCVDHVDGNRLNNQRENLRTCTHSQNLMNQKLNKKSTSGIPGIHFLKREQKWLAHIKIKGKQIRLGLFKEKQTAINTRAEAEIKYFKEFRKHI